MAYTLRQLAGIDPVDVFDGEPVYLDTPREPYTGPILYGTPPAERRRREAERAIDLTIRRLDLEAGLFDPFTDEEAASVREAPTFDPDIPF